jgi:SAM-dependent methyltransferase
MTDTYKLINSAGHFQYPPHFKLPPKEYGFDAENFFEKWIPQWEAIFKDIKKKPDVVGLEIGSLHGCSSIYALENIVNGPNSILYCVDINQSEYLKDNLSPYKNVNFIQGNSQTILRNFSHNGLTENVLDYVYIDGSHLAKDVLSDAVLSYHLLKPGGIMIFDDYGWGIHTNDQTQKPKLAIDCFLSAYSKYYELILGGWQVYIKKIDYIHSELEAEANYEKNNGRLSK